jgi:putative redox protein
LHPIRRSFGDYTATIPGARGDILKFEWRKPCPVKMWKSARNGRTACGIAVRMDAPKEGAYLTPMETALMALAGCTGMDVISILGKKRQSVQAMEIRLHGIRAEDHPRVYTGIEVEYVITGANVDPESVARSIELSMTKYCSVSAMFSKTAKIRTSFRILPAEENSRE